MPRPRPSSCPGYRPEPTALPEATGSTVGYATVADALAALHAKPGAVFRLQAGWTVVEDGQTLWSFPPPSDPSYPSAVKRQLMQTSSGVDITTSVHCESTKAACDNLVRQFEQLNAQMKAALARH